MPNRPTRSMQPCMTARLGPKRQQRITLAIPTATAETAPRHRTDGIAIQPFRDAAGEGALLCFRARERPIKLQDVHTLLEEDLPVLGRPAINGWSQHSQDARFVV